MKPYCACTTQRRSDCRRTVGCKAEDFVPRPIRFAAEVVAGLAIAVIGAWLAALAGGKLNDKVNRQAQAGERIAAALERAYPLAAELPRPSLLPPPPFCLKDARACASDRGFCLDGSCDEIIKVAHAPR